VKIFHGDELQGFGLSCRLGGEGRGELLGRLGWRGGMKSCRDARWWEGARKPEFRRKARG